MNIKESHWEMEDCPEYTRNCPRTIKKWLKDLIGRIASSNIYMYPMWWLQQYLLDNAGGVEYTIDKSVQWWKKKKPPIQNSHTLYLHFQVDMLYILIFSS